MKFMLLIYNDRSLVGSLPDGQADEMMRNCFTHADELRAQGTLHQSMQLEEPETARTVRIRNGKVTTTDGPFAEVKEMLGGFNIIEAESIEEATRIAAEFPWAGTGCVEVRPVRDIDAVRARVFSVANAAPRQTGALDSA